MRRALAIIGAAGILGLSACGGGRGADSTPASTQPGASSGNPITGPIDRARDVANAQSDQQRQLDQQTGQGDQGAP